MDNHPIPQDITGFQFKLIGSMTVKQFAYLAGGIGVAWIFFILPIPQFLKLLIAIVSVAFGASLAFVPIAGRPMDTMLANLLRAIFSPTQYVYKQEGGDLASASPSPKIASQPVPVKTPEPLPTITLAQQIPIAQLPPQPAPVQKTVPSPQMPAPLPQKTEPLPQMVKIEPTPEQNMPIMADASLPSGVISTATAPATDNSKTDFSGFKEMRKNLDDLEKKEHETGEEEIEKELQEAKKEEQAKEGSAAYNDAHGKVLDLEGKLSETLAQKQALEEQLRDLQKQLQTQQQGKIYVPGTAEAKTETQTVRKIPAGQGKSFGMPNMPQVPNLVSGIIKDPRGNPLGNILVEIKDADENPVRAFKTNGLGQFASATPLSNGVYTIQFEDPQAQSTFDTVEITVDGNIVAPIEVISSDAREELRKQLFN